MRTSKPVDAGVEEIGRELYIPPKDVAFAPRPDEKHIPIEGKYQFRRRWFHSRNCCTFSTFLPGKFPPNVPHNVITIGVFEAAQEVWLMQNILQHPESFLVGIDPWLPTYKRGKVALDQEFMDQCYANARANLSEWGDRAKLIRGHSQTILIEALEAGECQGVDFQRTWDLVIIDGDHEMMAVYQDAKNALQLVRKGGWLLFDDVHNNITKKDEVQEGLRMFIRDYGDQVEAVWYHRFCGCFEKVV